MRLTDATHPYREVALIHCIWKAFLISVVAPSSNFWESPVPESILLSILRLLFEEVSMTPFQLFPFFTQTTYNWSNPVITRQPITLWPRPATHTREVGPKDTVYTEALLTVSIPSLKLICPLVVKPPHTDERSYRL